MGDNVGRGLWWPALLVVVLLACGLLGLRGVHRLELARDQLERVEATNQRLERENQALYRSVLRLRSDPQALARAARLKQGMLRPDEVVYQEPAARPAPGPAKTRD